MYDGDMPAHQDAGCRIPEIQNKGQYKLWSIDFRSGISMTVVTTSSRACRPNSGEPEFLTVKDVAAIMNMSVKTVYEKAGKDEIPHHRFWGSVRFREDEFLAWLDEQRSGPRVS
jgi:excisionase family DNA binding protein